MNFLSAEGNSTTIWIFVGLLVVLVVLLLVVPMFTNKKRAKQTNDLHNSLQPGDVVKTVGGIIGTIKEIRQISPNDREMLIETGEGDNKTTMLFDIQALYQIMSRASSSNASVSGNVFDTKAEEAPVEKSEPVAASEEKSEPAVEEHAEAVEKTEEPAVEQAAVVDEKVEEKTEEPAVEPVAKPEAKKTTSAPKSNSTHKTTASKSTNGSAKKKSTNSADNSSKK